MEYRAERGELNDYSAPKALGRGFHQSEASLFSHHEIEGSSYSNSGQCKNSVLD